MTSAERQRAIAYLEDSRTRLLQKTRALSHSQLQFKPALDRWSIAEILEHLAFTEQRAVTRIQNALAQPAADLKTTWQDDALVQAIAARATRVSAPGVITPNGRWPLDRLLPEFEAARASTLDFAKNTSGDLRQRCIPHPLFGPLDCYQWLIAIPAHCERHRLQVEELIAVAGFPRAASA